MKAEKEVKEEGEGVAGERKEESDEQRRSKKHTLLIRWHLDYVKILHVVMRKFHMTRVSISVSSM